MTQKLGQNSKGIIKYLTSICCKIVYSHNATEDYRKKKREHCGGKNITMFFSFPNLKLFLEFSFQAKWRLHYWMQCRHELDQKQILYSQFREESSKTGTPKLRHKNVIKRSLGMIRNPRENRQYQTKKKKTGGKNPQNVIIGFESEW